MNDDAVDDTMQDTPLGAARDDMQNDRMGEQDATVLTDPPVEPGEAVAETVASHELDPADVVDGDDAIAEHVAEGEGAPN